MDSVPRLRTPSNWGPMTDHLGRGPFLSLRRRINGELADLRRRNAVLRAARYAWPVRLLRFLAGDRGLGRYLFDYLALALVLAAGQLALARLQPGILPPTLDPDAAGTLKDIGSYLLGGQLTVLGVVAVAVSVVTLLAQRTEGASARTEIRLYYVESFAYELATGGVALAIVLALQLFWPLQVALTVIFGDADLVASETLLTVVHTVWLAVNLALFFQFLMTTLRFVEPSARMRLREQYAASAVLPHDVHRRLLPHLYVQLADPILGKASAATGPHLSVGFARRSFPDAIPQVTRRFRRSMQLVDIWERPLAWAMRSWAARVRRREAPQSQPLMSGRSYGNRVVISAFAGETFKHDRPLVLVTGPIALSWWERRLIAFSLRFRPPPVARHELPAPNDILEELADQVIGQIDRSARTGFRAALAELIHFHRFMLAAQHGTDASGAAFNLAQLGGLFARPTQGWVGEYQRLYTAAASRLGEDSHFIDQLSYLVHRLMPDDADEAAPGVVTDILDLGVYEVLALEAWVTRRTTLEVAEGEVAVPRLALAGSDLHAYQNVVVKLVGSWETLLSRFEHRYGLDAGRDLTPDQTWRGYGRAWTFVETHLRASAIMLAAAVWNEDAYGAGRYRDMLLRWPERLEVSDRMDGRLRHRALLTPGWFDLPLADVSAAASGLSNPPSRIAWPPDALFSALWRGAFDDTVILAAAVTLSWTVRDLQNSDLGGETARLLLRREALDDGGRPLRGGASLVLAKVIALIIRGRFGLRPASDRYGDALDQLVQSMNGMSDRTVVPGRVYTTWGSRGVESLDPELLAIAAAFTPSTGDGGVGRLIETLARDESLFINGDVSLQDAIYGLEQFAGGLGRGLDVAAFERAVHLLSPDWDAAEARTRLAEILATAAATLRESYLSRLRAAAVDPEQLDVFATRLQARLLERGLPLAPLQLPVVETGQTDVAVRHRIRPRVDKGLFTRPMRSRFDLDDTVVDVAEELRGQLASAVTQSLVLRPKETVRLSAGGYPRRFWRAVRRRAGSVGAHPVLVAPHGPITEHLRGWAHGYQADPPPDLPIEIHDDKDTDEGAQYIATVAGFDVYSADIEDDRAFLFSATALKRITLKPHGPEGHWVDVACRKRAGGELVDLDFGYALACEWDDSPLFEFRIQGTVPDEGD